MDLSLGIHWLLVSIAPSWRLVIGGKTRPRTLDFPQPILSGFFFLLLRIPGSLDALEESSLTLKSQAGSFIAGRCWPPAAGCWTR